MKKAKWTRRVALLAAACVVASVFAVACATGSATRAFGPATSDEVSAREIRNGQLAVRAAEEGMVLLRNDGALPLKAGSTVALYGNGAVCTIKGGTGSGDVNQRNIVNYYQGLSEVYSIANTEYLEAYARDWDLAQAGELAESTAYVDDFFLYDGVLWQGNAYNRRARGGGRQRR